MNGAPVSEHDLHAYVDGELDAAARQRVERHLAAHPQDAARVRDWAAQRAALRLRLGAWPEEPAPPAWSAVGSSSAPAAHERRVPGLRAGRFGAHRWAAAVLAGVLGLAGGWAARSAWPEAAQPAALAGLPRQAAVAHAVYAPDARRPVEVAQAEPLVTWLSKRLGVPVRPPDLRAEGYELIGGRLLPGRTRPVAQFMYEDRGGRRLTLYLTTEMPPGTQASFRFAHEAGAQVMYWVDGAFGYALASADLDRPALARLARAVHTGLAPS